MDRLLECDSSEFFITKSLEDLSFCDSIRGLKTLSTTTVTLDPQPEEDVESEWEFAVGDMEARGSAATGLTMKEYDEQLRKLTAENFQLKLKIYFMDSRLSKMEGVHDKDLIKENVDLKVTNETQSKELESKQKLLFEASEAFEQLQNEHQEALKKLTSQFEKEKGELKVRVAALDASVRLMGQQSFRQASEEEIASLNCKVESLEQEIKKDALTIEELTKALAQKTQEQVASSQRIQKLEEIEDKLRCRVLELEEECEVEIIAAENSKLKEEVSELQNRLKAQLSPRNVSQAVKVLEDRQSELLAKLAELESNNEQRGAEFKSLEAEHRKACATIKTFVRKVQVERSAKERLAEELRAKDAAIEEMRRHFSGHRLSHEDSQTNTTLGQIQKLEEEVEGLVKKQAANASVEITNELSAKKIEIERLQCILKKRIMEFNETGDKEMKNDGIQERVKTASNDDVVALKSSLLKASQDRKALALEVERLRAREEPLKQACAVLTVRLEELAGFLDSLLTDRALLGLNHEQQDVMRRAVDKSRELSRNLTQSLDDGSLLGDSSVLNDQSLVISKLREQLSVLSQQVRERDIELAYCHNQTAADEHDSDAFLSIPHEIDESWLHIDLEAEDRKHHSSTGGKKKAVEKPCARMVAVIGARGLEFDASESEAWSEPDRSVSLARMGRIDSASVTPLRLSKCADSSESSEGTLNESKNSGKRPRSAESESRKQQAKIKQLEETNKTLRAQLALLEKKLAILNRLGGDSGHDLLTEIQYSLSELDEARSACKRLKSELATTQEEVLKVKMDLTIKDEICNEQRRTIDDLETKNDEIILEYELRLVEATELSDVAKRKADDVERKLKDAEKERKDLELKVVAIQKKVEDTKRLKTETSAHVIEATKHLDTAERIMMDAERDKEASERKVRELQQFVDCLRKEMEVKTKEVEMWTMRTAKEKEETIELKRRLQEAEKSKTAVELKVKEAKERIQWMESKLRELEQAMDQCDQEAQARIAEEVRRGVEAQVDELRKNWVSRVDLENSHKKIVDLEGKLKVVESQKRVLQEGFKEREEDLLKKISLIEAENQDLCRQLDSLKVQSSEIELELTRLSNEKLQLEESLRRAVEKQNGLLRNQQQAEERFLSTIRNLEKQVEDEGSCGAQAGVSNDLLWARNLNTSPDLGIESDQGRFSSLEHQDQRALVPRIHCETSISHLEAENSELRKRCVKMGQTLEETLAELAAANHHKKQMERAICKQLHKTHHILKKARINFELQDSDSVDDRP